MALDPVISSCSSSGSHSNCHLSLEYCRATRCKRMQRLGIGEKSEKLQSLKFYNWNLQAKFQIPIPIDILRWGLPSAFCTLNASDCTLVTQQ